MIQMVTAMNHITAWLRAPAAWLLACVLAAVVSPPLCAQRVVLRSMDLSSYPTVRASLYTFDSTGAAVLPDTTKDRRITDNGTRQTLGTIRLDAPVSARPFALTFLVDATSPSIPKALQSSLGDWDKFITTDHDAALIAFGSLPYIVRNFADTKLTLRDAVSRIPVLRGFDPTAALGDTLCGALNIAEQDKRARAIVLITDAQVHLHSYTLGDTALVDSLIHALRSRGIQLCVISINARSSASMRSAAQATGGVVLDSIPLYALGSAVQACAQIVQGVQSATFEWANDAGSCDNNRSVHFDVRSVRSELLHHYAVSDTLLRIARIVPEIIQLPDIAPGEYVDIPISIVAPGADFTLTDIRSDNPFCVLRDALAPTLVTQGMPAQCTLRCTRTSALQQRALLSVQSTACASSSGMVWLGGSANTTITPVIQTQLAGMVLAPGFPMSISWSGVLPNDTTTLELSTDAGSTWSIVSTQWRTSSVKWIVPLLVAPRCRLRVQSGLQNSYGISDEFAIAPGTFDVQSINAGIVRVAKGTERMDQSSEQVFNGVFRNTRSTPVYVDSVRSSAGGGKARITVLRGENTSVAPGFSWNCELQILADSVGVFFDTLNVFLDDAFLRVPVRVEAVEQVVFTPGTVYLGRVSVGGAVDSVVQAAVRVSTAVADSMVACTRMDRLFPDTVQYVVRTPVVPFILNSRAPQQPATVMFRAERAGISASQLLVETSIGTHEIRLIANAVCGAPLPRTQVVLPDTLKADIGENLCIPLRFAPLPAGYTPLRRPWSVTLRVPADILFPVNGTPPGERISSDRRITINGSGFVGGDTITKLFFTTALGASNTGTVFVESFRWLDECTDVYGPATADLVVGNACEAGGLRRYLSGDSLHIVYVAPNPAQEQTEIRYVLRETGLTVVEVVDIFGRTRVSTEARVQERGEHVMQVALNRLGDGEYFVRITTPTASTAKSVKVVR